MAKIINAVAGILCAKNQVLLASRPNDKFYAGYWEFPGGKIEAGENAKQALVRELHEEIGVVVVENELQHLLFLRQPYLSIVVNLDVMLITKWGGTPIAVEGQQLYWHDLSLQCDGSKLLLPTTAKILNLLQME